jgi:hypothetical protein
MGKHYRRFALYANAARLSRPHNLNPIAGLICSMAILQNSAPLPFGSGRFRNKAFNARELKIYMKFLLQSD